MVATITFEPFPSAQLAAWLKTMLVRYIDERVLAGESVDEAQQNANASKERLYPNGSPAPGHQIGRLRSQGQAVGALWIGPTANDPDQWWVWEIVIDEEFRGRGFGRQAMLLAEEIARTNGASTIGLNVFGHNKTARSLYLSLGFVESSVQMRKAL